MSLVAHNVDDGVTCRLASGHVEFIAPGGGAVTDPVVLGRFVSAFLHGMRSDERSRTTGVHHIGGYDRNGGYAIDVRCVGCGSDGGRTDDCVGGSLSVDDAVGVGFVGGIDSQGGSVSAGHSTGDVDGECIDGGRRGTGDGSVRVSGAESTDVGGKTLSGFVRGKNYLKNKAKREAAKSRRSCVKDLKDVCPSLSGSVCTVDTRTANEIEAADTLASCRVVENKVKQRMAELRLQSLNDKDKTSAVRRLEAARMEQRINDAKARSQASFKKCDNSLKSLGSTGSAGEFALKSALTKQESLQQAYDSLVVQVQTAIRVGGDDVRQAILAIPEPKKCGIRDVMNEPDDSWPEDEIEAYYAILNEEASGNYDSDWAGFLSSNKRKF